MKTLLKLCPVILSLSLVGCDNMNHTDQNILSTAALGTIGGAALGSLSGHAGEGALIGAGVGAAAGYLHDRDKYYYDNEPRYYREYYYEEPDGYYEDYYYEDRY